MSSGTPFARAMALLDEAHDGDPDTVTVDGRTVAAERLYAERMTRWLERLAPDASEALRLAVRAQHLCRWEVPRSEYPEGRAGYKKWRSELMRRHAERASACVLRAGYDTAMADRVAALVQKRGLKVDGETQLLEDCACLVFLEHYFADFAARHDDDKLEGIVTRTWKKMSAKAREEALKLPFSGRSGVVLMRALKQ